MKSDSLEAKFAFYSRSLSGLYSEYYVSFVFHPKNLQVRKINKAIEWRALNK